MANGANSLLLISTDNSSHKESRVVQLDSLCVFYAGSDDFCLSSFLFVVELKLILHEFHTQFTLSFDDERDSACPIHAVNSL